jgi:hypothetical protein
VIGGNHGLGGRLQMPEPVRLARHAAGDFLQISCHIRELNPKAADPVRKLIDQTFGVRGDGCSAFQLYGLRNRHRCIPPGE